MTISSTPLTDKGMALVEDGNVLAPAGADVSTREQLAAYEMWDLTVDFSDGGTLYMTAKSPVDGTLFNVTGPDDEEAGLLFMVEQAFELWLGRPVVAFAGGIVTGPGMYTVTYWA